MANYGIPRKIIRIVQASYDCFSCVVEHEECFHIFWFQHTLSQEKYVNHTYKVETPKWKYIKLCNISVVIWDSMLKDKNFLRGFVIFVILLFIKSKSMSNFLLKSNLLLVDYDCFSCVVKHEECTFYSDRASLTWYM